MLQGRFIIMGNVCTASGSRPASAWIRVFACLLAVWGLLIAPELCLAGLLVSCSAERSCAEQCECSGEACGEPAHDCNGSEDCCQCVQACHTVSVVPAKASPAELGPSTEIFHFVVPPAVEFDTFVVPGGVVATESPPGCYPRPPSDRPLLV